MMKSLFVCALLAASAAPSFAAPGDAPAVLSHCGTPDKDSLERSEVSNLPQRVLTYGNIRLNFQRSEDATGWNFVDGWVGRFPATRGKIVQHLPCVNDALDEAQVQNQNLLAKQDPAIAQQSAVLTQPHGAFGINHLWFIVFLAGIIAIFAIALPRRKRVFSGPDPKVRPFHRPRLLDIRARRRRKVFPAEN